ncbi:MAG: bifunctional (p)ppGpp synthetase/guanosine-3',5'-bis(diphosphate) 3'-pyrophosphohydrolase [Bacteroidales bacterium]|nr:bifunctional (p)ppGpp synthetase/guanosine-3',5'-bis(diphosphate) 3'-pyrophosphohydrolase [Bacteroidales bacterium]
MGNEEILFSADEEKAIDEAFARLLESYLQSKHRKKVELVTRAFNFARQAHNGVRRHSGEPYIMHPLAVAQIVSAEMGLGSTSICSALLHDVVEDTDFTIEDIHNVFGPKIAQIVDGLTKIAGGRFGDKASAQAENFKKLLLTMSDDIRMIIIKIADRLDNMRTLEHLPLRKQYKISGETLYIYAPLAYRLGLNKIKTELEDLSFRFEHPEEYAAIQRKLASARANREKVYNEFVAPIEEKLKSMGLTYSLRRRTKTPYSIWHKMTTKGLTFEEIYDIFAVRIIFEPSSPETEMNDCFNIYLALTQIYKSHPDRLRDWVTRPKSNGYQALHVTLMSNRGEWVEVQIRSSKMDDIAENGIAAHWKYKTGEVGTLEEDDSELNHWLGTIREILEDPQPDSMDFLDTIKLNLFSTEIFIFTPKGEFKTMPQGSTVLDFAFSIHTYLGTHCIGAKVNHKLVPVSYVLQSGDQVEVLTSKNQKVQHDWMEIATTAPARAKLRAILRKEDRESQRFGEALLNDFVKEGDFEMNSRKMEELMSLHGAESREELMMAIGRREVILNDQDRAVLKGDSGGSWYSKLFSRKKPQPSAESTAEAKKKPVIDTSQTLVVTDSDLHNYNLAKCCNPVPGDDVIGFVDDEGVITIHQRKCEVANMMKSGKGNRIVTVEWRTEQSVFPVSIYLKGIDAKGTMSRIVEVISDQMNDNIKRISIETDKGLFEGTLQVQVHSLKELTKIKNGLKKIQNITTVVRKEE